MKSVVLISMLAVMAIVAFAVFKPDTVASAARYVGERISHAIFGHMARSGLILFAGDTIDKPFVVQWDASLRLAAQQKQSRLRRTITERGKIEGSSFTISNIGTTELEEKVIRLGDTDWADTLFGARNVPMRDFYRALPLDRADIPKMKVNPVTGGMYMQTLMAAKNRRTDDVIYQAALATILGQDGTTSFVLPAGQKIAAGGTGLTKAKMIQAKTIMRANEVDSFEEGEEMYMLYNSVAMGQILADNSLTSADFLAGQMLQTGKIANWLGFTWIPYERLNLTGAVYSAVAYTKDAIHLGEGYEEGSVDKRPDKQNAWQVAMMASYGAGRQDEKKVVQIDFQ